MRTQIENEFMEVGFSEDAVLASVRTAESQAAKQATMGSLSEILKAVGDRTEFLKATFKCELRFIGNEYNGVNRLYFTHCGVDFEFDTTYGLRFRG